MPHPTFEGQVPIGNKKVVLPPHMADTLRTDIEQFLDSPTTHDVGNGLLEGFELVLERGTIDEEEIRAIGRGSKGSFDKRGLDLIVHSYMIDPSVQPRADLFRGARLSHFLNTRIALEGEAVYSIDAAFYLFDDNSLLRQIDENFRPRKSELEDPVLRLLGDLSVQLTGSGGRARIYDADWIEPGTAQPLLDALSGLLVQAAQNDIDPIYEREVASCANE